MSYEKAMKFARNPKKGKAQYMGFCTLAPDERRKDPWFSYTAFEDDPKGYKRAVDNYDKETERLLKENPNLKLV